MEQTKIFTDEERAEQTRNAQNNNVGSRYIGATLKKIDFGTRKNEVYQWLRNARGFMLYLGGVGIGKTYFCSALIGRMHGVISYRYWKETELLKSIRMEMDNRHMDYLESLKHKIDCEYLMLDDICGKIKSDWRNEVLFALIDQRYSYNKPTIITSNLSINQLAEELGERCMSRLMSKDNLVLEVTNGQDLRALGL